MKKLLFFFYIIFLCVIVIDCKKKDVTAEEIPTPTVPSQPTIPSPTNTTYTFNDETESAEDVHEILALLIDINMIAGHVCENYMTKAYFQPSLGASNGTMTAIRDSISKINLISFNKSLCQDGKKRDGSLKFSYSPNRLTNPNANPNANFYRDYAFVCELYPTEFSVDKWKVELFDASKPAHIYNMLYEDKYDATVVDLSWQLSGKFRFVRNSDDKEIIWEGDITKTLSNTEDQKVFNLIKLYSIQWNNSIVLFTGSGNGDRFGEPFQVKLGNGIPLTKNFTCNFAPMGTTATSFHPFVSGVTSFSLSNYHPRYIDYGPTSDCDNLTTVSFKDKKYSISLN